jgi:hypothetical protein
MEFRIIRFIDQLRVVTTNFYNTIADVHILYITTAHATSFPACNVFTRYFLLTASNNGYSSASVPKSSLNGGSFQLNYFSQTPVRNWLGCPSFLPYNSSARPAQTTPFLSYMRIRCGNVFTEPLPSTGRLFLLIKNVLPSNGRLSVVCFAAVAYKLMLLQIRLLVTAVSLIPQFLLRQNMPHCSFLKTACPE